MGVKNMNNKPFGNILTKDNYQALRGLAQKLTCKEFMLATGFKSGIHTRLRSYSTFEAYKEYTNANAKKYYPRRSKKTITLKDVYQELQEIKRLLIKND